MSNSIHDFPVPVRRFLAHSISGCKKAVLTQGVLIEEILSPGQLLDYTFGNRRFKFLFYNIIDVKGFAAQHYRGSYDMFIRIFYLMLKSLSAMKRLLEPGVRP
jgi:hypothetical protein